MLSVHSITLGLRMIKHFFIFLVISLTLCACSTTPPKKPKDLCEIFKEKSSWYDDAQDVYAKRGVPINIVMSFMYHESGYVDDAQPPMRWFLFIPYGRGSSAYGYAQAQDPVWDDYVSEAGGFFSSRDDFADSLDFISWYILKTNKVNKVKITDVYNQYLNYHEGWGGYRKKTHAKNKSLQQLARKVETTASNYAKQLRNCNL